MQPVSTPTDWKPDGWKARKAKQQARYDDPGALQHALSALESLPPLVTSWEVLSLKRMLSEVQAGKRFLLQGGDCAESFADCNPSIISNRLKVLLQMSLVLIHGLRMPVVRVGRFAGQFAKPRSSDTETRNGVTLPSYRGDLVNGQAFTPEARRPDPNRLLQGHSNSAITMNFVRALIEGGFADLHHPEYWKLDWMERSEKYREYQELVKSISDSVHFSEILAGRKLSNLSRVDFFSSHEALHLPYEQALTRQVPRQWGWFNLSTHFPWIGLRTNDVDGAHVEFLRGIRNPVGVKVGADTSSADLVRLAQLLNPDRESGKLLFIHRLGADKVESELPRMIQAMKKSGHEVIWSCDPMHGNTESTSNGFKTRRFENIRNELELSFKVHKSLGSHLGGVHLELTGENVTECLGGARELVEEDLLKAYKSQVDPRLNYEQSLEMAMAIVGQFQRLYGIPDTRGQHGKSG